MLRNANKAVVDQTDAEADKAAGLKAGGIGAAVEVVGVSKRFGKVRAVDDVSFAIAPGEFVSLLGPSGSGKTTILMNLAGFQQPTMGQLIVGGRDVVPLPAQKRNIGMVFQKYALFPHMTVAENIAFPLQMRGWPKARLEEAVRQVLSVVRLDGYAERRPVQLSGGQQQRVALARAIVFEPPLLLMDEPLGALDKKLREELQVEIKVLQQRLGITVLFVTHDQSEALAMSDRIAVMNEGRIEQIGEPTALYRTPRTIFVGDFMGDSNFFNGKVTALDRGSGIATINADGHTLRGKANVVDIDGLSVGAEACIMVRPESLTIQNHCADSGLVSGTISSIQFGGSSSIVAIAGHEKTLIASTLR